MALPTLNLQQIIDQIEWAEVSEKFRNNPSSVTPAEHQKFKGWGLWNQGVWAQRQDKNVCGTAYCQAGEAALRGGYKFIWHDDDPHTYTVKKDGKMFGISEAALLVLGLTDDEGSLYFDGDNTIADLKFYANAFAFRRGLPQPYSDQGELNTPYEQDLYDVDDVVKFLGGAERSRV